MKHRHALVIGLGISGQAAASYLLKRGVVVTGIDRKAELFVEGGPLSSLQKRGLRALADGSLDTFEDIDLVVVSPGVPLTHPYCQAAQTKGIEIIGEVELACREMKQKCLAVTGTNGKTTVTLLTDHILRHCSIKSKALGNVGIPLTSALEDPVSVPGEVVVLELSSFQLETLESVFIDAGVLLNITPDHLDRYASMDEYAQAKVSMAHRIKSGGCFYVEENCFAEFRSHFRNQDVRTYGNASQSDLFTDLSDVYLEGKRMFALPQEYQGKRSHHVENLLAAFALCHAAGVPSELFVEAVQSFKRPAHRIQSVRILSGVHFYDDSKGTNIDAVIRAVQEVPGPVVLIAGGVDKGFPYVSWLSAFGGKVQSVCAIGQAKERIRNDLDGKIPVTLHDGLEEAVKSAAAQAKAGGTVLLSPGCSSFDMFRDYAHRGEEFQRIVNSIESLR